MGLLTQYDTGNQRAPKAVYVSLKKSLSVHIQSKGKIFRAGGYMKLL